MQISTDLAPAPGRVLCAHPEHLLLNDGRGNAGVAQGPARLIGEALETFRFKTLQPFVASLATDAKASA